MRLFLCLLMLVSSALRAGAVEARVERDLEYARVGEISLKLDLYVPQEKLRPPLLVWVHGGAWRSGSKENMPLKGLLAEGFPIASVDYRLSTIAPFPAQAHDLKAAIRFLRATAAAYGVNGISIGIVGSSAGGHLTALVGVSNGVAELEGTEGDYRSTSSNVQAVISLFGASNLQSILGQSTPHGLSVREPALRLLLGGLPEEKPELARLASPVAHVNAGDPPLLLIHGDADPQMPPEQSHELKRAYANLKLPVTLIILPGIQHGGPEFFDEQRTALITAFLTRAVAPEKP